MVMIYCSVSKPEFMDYRKFTDVFSRGLDVLNEIQVALYVPKL